MKDGYRSTQPYNPNLVIGMELYDYKNDPLEEKNVAKDKGYQSVAKDLHSKMLAYFQVKCQISKSGLIRYRF